MHPTETQQLKRAVVRTYDTPSYADPWAAVEDYERVQRLAADHPNKGSAALSTITDLPRGRIRPWLDGAMPDCYRALQTIQKRGWLPGEWQDETMIGLTTLTATIYASGSIAERTFVPRFIADDRDECLGITDAADRLGITLDQKTEKPPEYEPRNDAPILGRLLTALGCPVGDKNSETVTTLPDWIENAPPLLQQEFIRVYVQLRGHDRNDRPGIQLKEDRSDQYRQELEALLQRAVSDPGDISTGSWPIYITDTACDELQRPRDR